MKPLVIYHDNCADGFVAAFAAWLRFGDEAEYLPMQYNQAEYNPQDRSFVVGGVCHYLGGREVYVLDFSFGRQLMDELFSQAKRVVWLDHHKSAFEMWMPSSPGYYTNSHAPAQKDIIILNNNKSGAILAWEYFHPGTDTPMLFRHIDDYDRWQFKIDGTKEFNKALWSYAPWSFEQWERWLCKGASVPNLIDDGAAILRAQDAQIKSMLKQARKCEIHLFVDGAVDQRFKGLALNTNAHISEVGHELALQSGTFGLCWSMSESGMAAKCSLRSNGDYDVSSIAKAFGGGGHKNAAGFEVSIEVLLGWMK